MQFKKLKTEKDTVCEQVRVNTYLFVSYYFQKDDDLQKNINMTSN